MVCDGTEYFDSKQHPSYAATAGRFRCHTQPHSVRQYNKWETDLTASGFLTVPYLHAITQIYMQCVNLYIYNTMWIILHKYLCYLQRQIT